MVDNARAADGTIESPHPFLGAERYQALDVLRGFALLGIFAMNIMTFAMPFAAYGNPTIFLEYEGSNAWTYRVTHVVFDFKMMTLFSMLFGAGVVMYSRKITDRSEVARVRWLWIRRMFWLFVIGMVHAYFIWEGDILVGYAVCGLVALWWLRRLPPFWMLLVAFGFFFVSLLGGLGFGYWASLCASEEGRQMMMEQWGMSPEEVEEATRPMLEMMAPTPELIEEQRALYTGPYAPLFRHRAEMVVGMQLWMIPMFLFWRGTAMMLLGAALTKLGVLTGARSIRAYALLMVIGYAVGLPIVIGGIAYNESHGFDPSKLMLWGMQINGVGSVPVALGHVGLVMLLFKSGLLGWLANALAAVGRMALTNYIAQSVIGVLVFYGYGLGYWGQFNRLQQELVVLAVWAAQLAWSPLWLSRFRFGPMEWLWRSLTYMKPQPMAKARPTADLP